MTLESNIATTPESSAQICTCQDRDLNMAAVNEGIPNTRDDGFSENEIVRIISEGVRGEPKKSLSEKPEQGPQRVDSGPALRLRSIHAKENIDKFSEAKKNTSNPLIESIIQNQGVSYPSNKRATIEKYVILLHIAYAIIASDFLLFNNRALGHAFGLYTTEFTWLALQAWSPKSNRLSIFQIFKIRATLTLFLTPVLLWHFVIWSPLECLVSGSLERRSLWAKKGLELGSRGLITTVVVLLYPIWT